MASHAKPERGQILDGRFLLLEEIGSGGMATVFRATDLADGAPCAVKIPLPIYASGVGSWSMFQREAEIGTRLDHPALLKFIPLPAAPHRQYVVTEFVAGRTLATMIGHGRRFTEAEAFRLMKQLCDAVAHLHRRGIVHYDLKPKNVIVREEGTLCVIDFGLAHQVATGRFAFSGSVPPIASSGYVAPEQISRKRGQKSVDIYALGAMLYEMLTGVPPFENDDPFVIASAPQIGDPTAPRLLVPTISLQAEEIVLRALRRNPKDRYADVTELARALEDPARVPVTGLSERLVPVTAWRRRLRRIRFIAAIGIAPIALLLLSFRLLWWYLEHPR
jgi:serine/threonine-protein kinase